MKELNLKEKQACLLEILVFVDKLFRKNNLNYSLAYGTLIGAARHKGFIPWDDDLDIVMPYNDYIKMLNLPELNNLNKRYTLHYRKSDKDYGYPFAKIEDTNTICYFKKTTDKGGAFLDIFPMTLLPDKGALAYSAKMDKLHKKLAFIDSKSLNPLKNSIHYLSHPFRRYYRDKMIDYAFKYQKYSDSGLVTDSTWSNDRVGQAVPKEWFDDYTDLEFELHKFKAISNYKSWLKIIYGDWEKLPPKNERIGHHEFELYLKER